MIEILAQQREFYRMKSTLRSRIRAFGLLSSLELSFHKFTSISYLKTAQVPTAQVSTAENYHRIFYICMLNLV